MSIDKLTAKQIGADVEAALQAVAAKHGMTVTVRGGSFTPGTFKPRVEFKTADADRSEFDRYCGAFGLTPDAFGRTFAVGVHRYRVVGLRLSSRKMPIIVERLDGKQYVFPAHTVRAGLTKEAL